MITCFIFLLHPPSSPSSPFPPFSEREEVADMGKLNHLPFITHFSHPHQLELYNLDLPNHHQTHYPPLSSNSCSACNLPQTSGYIYTCKTCSDFSLHLSCSQMPHQITHPSHPYHPLSLSPTSDYPGGKFSCDACKNHSHGFSYHCSSCSFDLHIKCVLKPLVLNHHLHPHPLDLTFAPPYGDGTGFSCDVCRHVGTSHWLYRCVACEFDVHLECPSATVRPTSTQTPAPMTQQPSMPAQQIRPQQSMPATITNKIKSFSKKMFQPAQPLAHQQSMPAMSVGGGQPGMGAGGGGQGQMQYNYYPQQQQQQQVQPPVLQHSSSVGPIMQNQQPPPAQPWQNQNQGPVMQNQQPPLMQQSWQGQAQAQGMQNQQPPMQPWQQQQQQQPQPAQGGTMGDMIMQAAVQGLVEGAAQQAGQTLVQDFILNDESYGGGDQNSGESY